MTKPKTESLLSEYVDVDALAAAAQEDRPRASEPSTLLEEFLDVPASAPRGRASPAEIAAERVRRDVADRLGVTIDPEAA